MKIALLAMSGIRAHDPNLLALGLTLPGVVERGRVLASLPSLGLLNLAAVTPARHDTRYFEAPSASAVPAEVFEADLVAISTFTAQAREAYVVADRLREAGVRVVMGGLHVSVRPDEALEHADYVVAGEAENVWPDALRAIEKRMSQRLWRASDFRAVDVGTLPLPRYDLLVGRPYTRFTVQTTRGCPWRCDFCASNVMFGQPYRKRPVDAVVHDIEAVKKIQSRPFIEFADDNTFVDHEWGKELCRRLASLNIQWFTETDISVADDEELLALMRRSGCRQVLIGVESPEQPSLEGIETRSNFKARRWGGCRESLRRIQQHGITANGCFVLGLDGHGPDIFAQVLDFAESVPLYDVQITMLTPFPGTPLYDRLHRQGRLIEPERWEMCTLFDVNYRPAGMTADQLRAGMYWLAERLYSDEALARRRRGFFEQASARQPA